MTLSSLACPLTVFLSGKRMCTGAGPTDKKISPSLVLERLYHVHFFS